MTNKYHVKEINGFLFIYGPGDKEFAGPFFGQEEADNTCASMNGLMRDWPPEAKSDERQETAG